jgi:hypothetical protein
MITVKKVLHGKIFCGIGGGPSGRGRDDGGQVTP